MTGRTRITVLPLCRDDPKPVRKQRVAELHDLYLRSGCNAQVMWLLLKQRHRIGER